MNTMEEGARQPPRIFHGMNLMRGVAAIAVVVFHSDPLFGVQLVQSGYLAVDFFFLLSGFVIAHAYDRRLVAGMGIRSFAIARLVRFLPLYLVGISLGLLLEALLIFTGSREAESMRALVWLGILGVLFLPVLKSGSDLFPLNVPAWSLHHELVVNLLYATFHRRLGTGVLVLIATIGCLGIVVGVFSLGHAAVVPGADHYAFGLARALFSFSVGVIIYRKRPGNWGLPPAFAMMIASAVFLVPASPQYRPWFDFFAIVVVFPLLLPSLVAFEPQSKSMKVASTLLGDMSYALYALHYPLIWLVRGAAEKFGLSAPVCGLALVISLPLICVVAERKFDLPLRKGISRWIAR